MVGIDKTYTDNYKEYKRFKDWADSQTVTFYDGHKVTIGDWVYLIDTLVTTAVYVKGLKGVVRHLKKQYLPAGVKFNVRGKWVNQFYTITAL